MGPSQGLRVRNLKKSYGSFRALDGVDLEVGAGLYGLLGPNGAGKSTLMRTLATLQHPDDGQVTFRGIDVLAKPNELRRVLGYLPQQIGAYPGVKARRLLERFAWLKGCTDGAVRRREVALILERVNLSDAADREVATFSGGMLRRFGIAIALLGAPEVLIVDEPTAGLDPAERDRFHRVLADVAADAVVLLSTHIVDDVESLCGRLSILARGRVVAEGTPADLTSPLLGRIWEKAYERGQPCEVNALKITATPSGTRAVVVAETRPGDGWTPRAPRLEDAYAHVLAQHEQGAKA